MRLAIIRQRYTPQGGAERFLEGALEALLERGTSLLPAGVADVTGSFDTGDVVEIRDLQGVTIARGMALVDSEVMRSIKGKRTTDLPENIAHEAVHRDDLMILV